MNDQEEAIREVQERAERLPIDIPSPTSAMARGRRRRRLSIAATTAAALVIAVGVAVPLRALMRLGEEASPAPAGPSPSDPIQRPDPTGTIAFIGGGQAFGPITLLDVASGATEPLTRSFFNSVSLAWSPDGSLIAMTRSLSEGNGELVLVSTQTGKVMQTMPLDPLLHPQDVDWSPDGRSLAFTDTYQRLHLIDIDGSNHRILSTDDRRALGIAFSPSGEEIAFIGDKGDLAVVNIAGKETRVIVSDREITSTPTWAPDGSRIAFTTDGLSLSVVSVDGSEVTKLVEGLAIVTSPSWSPDGNWISFEGGEEQRDLYAVAVDDRTIRQLTDTPSDEVGSDWGVDPDGSIDPPVEEDGQSATDLSSLGPGWTELPNPPEVRSESAAKVWTGSELLVWGGHVYTGFSNEVPGGDGFRWNPLTGRSQTMADAPLAPRDFPGYAWTGDELLVWGGSGRGARFADGAAYAPATDTWRTIAPSPLGSRAPAESLWTGDRFIVLGDTNRKDGSSASYNPVRDEWTSIPDAPTWVAEGLWTGDEVVVRSATGPELYSWTPGESAWTPLPSPPEAIASLALNGDGIVGLTWGHRALRFDIASGSWGELAASPLPENNYGPKAISLNGAIVDQQAHQVALLGSSSGTWRDITQKDSAVYGDNVQVVVADDVLIVLRRHSGTELERAFAYTP